SRRLLLGRLLPLERALPPRRRCALRLSRRRGDRRDAREALRRAAVPRRRDRRGEHRRRAVRPLGRARARRRRRPGRIRGGRSRALRAPLGRAHTGGDVQAGRGPAARGAAPPAQRPDALQGVSRADDEQARHRRRGGRGVAERRVRADDRVHPARAAREARGRRDLPRDPRASLVPLGARRAGRRPQESHRVVHRTGAANRARREAADGISRSMEPDPRRWQALAIVCVAFFMTVLDVSIVNVALPSIGRSLHFSETGLQWVITAYAITFGGFLLLGGRAGDILGRKRMFLLGVVIFSAASLACGLASSTGVLVAARAVQGFGAAIVSPSTLSIITTTFEEGAERNKALGIWGAMGGSGAAAGVLFGGILTKYLGWEWIFFVNVPVGALVLALTPRIVRESRAPGERHGFDVVGASSVTAGLALLVYA